MGEKAQTKYSRAKNAANFIASFLSSGLYRRFWILTKSAQNCARGLATYKPLTAGGEFRPALKQQYHFTTLQRRCQRIFVSHFNLLQY